MDEAKPITKLRAEAKDVEAFDKSMEYFFNLYSNQPEIDYPDGEKGFPETVCECDT